MVRRSKARRGLLAVISGPSGVGKSTVVRRAIKIAPELKLSISTSTRPPRPYEKDGVDYFFASESKFFEMEKKHEFLEWAQVHGYYYGTPKAYVERELQKNQAVILEVDVQGAAQIKEAISRGRIKPFASIFIFLIPPSVDILAFRLKRRRTEEAKEMDYRLRAALAELQVMEKYDYIVVNDRVGSAAEKIKAILEVERSRALLN